ncbi:MAG: endo alpha,4 polygalactosaminidase precursor [Acidimicrobiales bacterium]|nr:endo alpha,4 polygalactosaminidase precursor [Acidimicrobiales bacterium]
MTEAPAPLGGRHDAHLRGRHRRRGRGATVGLVAMGMAAASTIGLDALVAPPAGAAWIPPLKGSWDIQFNGTIDTNVPGVTMYDLSLSSTSAATAKALHAVGKRLTCYLSVGTYESWRPDAARFPAAVLGKPLGQWPGERWLDINSAVVRSIMAARLDQAKALGCDAVDPDNMDVFEQDSGFKVTDANQIAYNTWLAAGAHQRGMAVFLKNDDAQAARLAGSFDGAIVEQCLVYSSCDAFRPFTAAAKPVYEIEYTTNAEKACIDRRRRGFMTITKHLALDQWRIPCPIR